MVRYVVRLQFRDVAGWCDVEVVGVCGACVLVDVACENDLVSEVARGDVEPADTAEEVGAPPLCGRDRFGGDVAKPCTALGRILLVRSSLR